ncbi:MAG: DUF481 domain-containing protein [Acidobacteriota bacterium]
MQRSLVTVIIANLPSPTVAVRTAAAAALLLLLSTPTRAQDPLADAASPRTSEDALVEAVHARDRNRLEQLLASDYVLRGKPDISRKTWIDNALTLCWGNRSDIDAFRVREQGDLAVTSFELTFYVDPVSCRPAVLRSLITDVWIRRGAAWQLAMRQSGPASSGAGDLASQFGAVPQPPPLWDVSSDLSLTATGGNTSTRTLGLGSVVTHQTPAATTRVSIAFLTSDADAVTRARSLSMDARHGIRISERFDVFGRGSFARDRFAGIDGRVTAEAGTAYTPALPARHTLITEGSLGYTLEQRVDATELRFATATGAVRHGWTIVPGTQLSDDVNFIADLQSAANWRGTGRLAIAVSLTQSLALKASQGLEYRNQPVAGFRRLDLRTVAALVFSFKRPGRIAP